MQAKAMKLLKDVSDAAKEMAVFGLNKSSKGLESANSWLKAQAEKLTPAKGESDGKADEAKQ